MPKMATKAADNVFYKARIAAASWNDRLGSREGDKTYENVKNQIH